MKRFIAIFMIFCMVLGMSSVSAWADAVDGWNVETKIPAAPNSTFTSCTLDGKIYIFEPQKTSLQIYDTKSKTWQKGADLPDRYYTTASAAIGNKIYAICSPLSKENISIMLVYDPVTNTWTANKNIPKLNPWLGLAVVGQKLYAFYTLNGTQPCMSIYNTETGDWTSDKPLPSGIAIGSICVQGNSIYMVGGTTTVYDTNADTWKTVTKMPTTPPMYYTTLMADNKIYVMGGTTSTTVLNTVDIYDVETNSWTTGTPLNTPREYAKATLIDGKIYLIGGLYKGIEDTIVSFKVAESPSNPVMKLSVFLNEGESVQLSTSFNLDNNKNFTWSSTDEKVATVDTNGKVTAVAEGAADIYAQNADGTFKEYIPVKVVKGVADELRLAAHLKIGEKANLYLTDDASKVTWSSMDSSIATVAADGQITGVKKGLAIVKAELDGQAYQIYVRVNG